MSTTWDTQARCGACEAEFPVSLYRNLHVTRSPEVREAILAGRFQVFPCPGCGRDVRLEPTMLYTDFERWQWVAVFPTDAIRHRGELARMVEEGFHLNMEVMAPEMVKGWAPRFTRRVVFGLPALRGLLRCFDHGLNDRLVEVFKVQLLRDLAPELLHPGSSVDLAEVSEERLVFELLPPPDGDALRVGRRVSVPRSALAPLEAMGEGLAERFPAFHRGPVVDWRAPLHPDLPVDRDPLAGKRLRTEWML